MQQTINFSIDCEWLCNFVRDKVYYEGLDYSKGIDLLKESFGINDEISDDILRGKKVIRGINEGELVDDDKYSDYQAYLKRQEEKAAKLAIQNDMIIHPLNYVDPFATYYSYWEFERKLGNSNCAIADVIDFFEYHENKLTGEINDLSHTFLRGGCYGLELEEYFFKNHIIRGPVGSKFEFWDSLFDFFEKLLEEGSWLTKEDKIEIMRRQENHRAWKRAQYRKLNETLDEKIEPYINKIESEEKSKVQIDFVTGTEWAGEVYYVPTNKLSEYGIISPEGEFYACDFAAHKSAAYLIAISKKLKGINQDPDFDEFLGGQDDAKDLLFKLGYTFVNTIGRCGLWNKWDMDYEEMPQKAIDTCFDWQLWNSEN